MRIVLQRVARASVSVDDEEVAAIGEGLLLLVGVEEGDGPAEVEAAAHKIAGLRVFDDEEGKMNLGPEEVGAEVLVVSQFTLAASLAKGRRPSFARAADPERADLLIDSLADHLRHAGLDVGTGRFGATMEVELVNDGPVTLVLDVEEGGRIVR